MKPASTLPPSTSRTYTPVPPPATPRTGAPSVLSTRWEGVSNHMVSPSTSQARGAVGILQSFSDDNKLTSEEANEYAARFGFGARAPLDERAVGKFLVTTGVLYEHATVDRNGVILRNPQRTHLAYARYLDSLKKRP